MTITNSEVVGKFVEEDVDEVVGVVVGEVVGEVVVGEVEVVGEDVGAQLTQPQRNVPASTSSHVF